jgi:hypothetical protein
MLKPGQIDKYPDNLVELYSQTEIDIIADIARRISTYDYFIPSAEWQYKKLVEMGNVHDDTLKRLSKLTGKTKRELEKMMLEAGYESINVDDRIYKKAGLDPLPIEQSPALLEVLQAGINSTNGLFENLTRTTASTASKQFENILDNAYMQITTGAFDTNTAIRNAIKDLAGNGIASITYPSGHTSYIESAVRRAVITGVGQTAGKMQEARANEMGCDLMEITAHAGARPSHAAWQGKVVSRSGREGYLSLDDIGYGTGAGFKGWNCRHDWFPYFKGLSEPGYTEEQLEDYKAKNYEYNGEKMTEYEASQKQRAIERNIRRWKREYIGMQAAGQPTDEAAARIGRWQEIQKDFLKQTGLKRQIDREQILGFGKKEAQEAAKYNKIYSPKFLKIKGIDNSNKDTAKAIQEELKLIPKEHGSIIKDTVKEINIVSEGNSRYDRDKGKMYIFENPEPGEIIHELGHVIETKLDLYNKEDFIKVLNNGLENISLEDVIYDKDTYNRPIVRIQSDKFISEYQGRLYEEVGILNDDMSVNLKAMGEYFSEGYREFIMNPDNLRKKDEKLFKFIEGLG